MSADDDSTVSVCRFCLERGDCNNVLLNGIYPNVRGHLRMFTYHASDHGRNRALCLRGLRTK